MSDLGIRGRLRALRGVMRSLWLYYVHRRNRRMDLFYRDWVSHGSLAFDIGSHVGDRIACFRRLGARVIAVEPQPAMVRTLRWLYGRDRQVYIEPVAVSQACGHASLRLNLSNPSVSTLSQNLIAAARDAPMWRDQCWDAQLGVACTTLDTLIACHGLPRFIKIDVEGLEADVLAGLSHPVEALSFEFTTIQREVAQAAIAECLRLGFTRFNAVMGESFQYVHPGWLEADAMQHWLRALPLSANSGDVYAVQPERAMQEPVRLDAIERGDAPADSRDPP